LNAPVVSIWSGILRDGGDGATAWQRLVDGVRRTADYAAEQGVVVGFEPEPGMFVDNMTGYDELISRVEHAALKLTLDIGHVHCQDEGPIADVIRRYADQLVNVHLEDMRRGVHEHLMFGEGEIEFAPVFAALREVDYRGGVHVELSRHSHDGANTALRAMGFLSQYI
jgi:sugar phosphate isomerase/epimerase